MPRLLLPGLALLIALAGCRELPGRCSGKADRLCVEVTAPGDPPDALLVRALGGGKEVSESLDGVRAAFAERKRYVFELDLRTIPQAQEIVVQVQATYAGSINMPSGAGTWRRGGPQPLAISLVLDHAPIEMAQPADLRTGDGGNEDGGPRPTVWRGTAAGKLGDSFAGPTDACWTGSRLYVSDRDNHRVLIYTSVAPGAKAVGVIGQPNLTSTQMTGKSSGQVLWIPHGLYCEGNLLFVADTGFHRVLIFVVDNPAIMGPSTNLVIGQSGVNDQQSTNRGGPASARSLNLPLGVFWDHSRIYIADSGNHRVVGYAASSTADFGALANLDARTVLGQAEPGKVTSPPLTPNDSALNGPGDVLVRGGRLAVTDTNYNRALFFPAPPDYVAGAPAPAAYAVLGQAGFLTKNAGTGPNELSAPTSIRELGGQLFVSEFLGNRVVIFDRPLPTTKELGPSASAELGPSAFEGIKLKQPGGVALVQSGGPETRALIVPDIGNNRVLIFNPQ